MRGSAWNICMLLLQCRTCLSAFRKRTPKAPHGPCQLPRVAVLVSAFISQVPGPVVKVEAVCNTKGKLI